MTSSRGSRLSLLAAGAAHIACLPGATVASPVAPCFDDGLAYVMNGKNSKLPNGAFVHHPSLCQAACKGRGPYCLHFTWLKEGNAAEGVAPGGCWLLGEGATQVSFAGAVSGPQRCPEGNETVQPTAAPGAASPGEAAVPVSTTTQVPTGVPLTPSTLEPVATPAPVATLAPLVTAAPLPSLVPPGTVMPLSTLAPGAGSTGSEQSGAESTTTAPFTPVTMPTLPTAANSSSVSASPPMAPVVDAGSTADSGNSTNATVDEPDKASVGLLGVLTASIWWAILVAAVAWGLCLLYSAFRKDKSKKKTKRSEKKMRGPPESPSLEEGARTIEEDDKVPLMSEQPKAYPPTTSSQQVGGQPQALVAPMPGYNIGPQMVQFQQQAQFAQQQPQQLQYMQQPAMYTSGRASQFAVRP